MDKIIVNFISDNKMVNMYFEHNNMYMFYIPDSRLRIFISNWYCLKEREFRAAISFSDYCYDNEEDFIKYLDMKTFW